MGSLGRETGSTLYRWWSQVLTPDAPIPCPPIDLDWRAILLQVRAKGRRGGSWVGRGEEDPGVTPLLPHWIPESPPHPCRALSCLQGFAELFLLEEIPSPTLTFSI